MIDHVGIPVSDYARSKDFDVQALAPLGFELVMEFDGRVGGFARDEKPRFWIHQGETAGGVHVPSGPTRRTTSTPSTRPRSRPAGPTTAGPASGSTTTRRTTPPSSTTPMVSF
jgi:catechol 2,3-dioxygenase-like lactoylglutathione lyase family enzyme